MPDHPLPEPSKRANRHRDRVVALLLAGALLPLVLNAADPVLAQQAMTLNGPPVQVQPYVSEPGVPMITINPGTPNPFAGADGDGAATGTGTGTGEGGTSGGTVGDSIALSTMMGTDWGSTAIANAQSVGVNPSALAATCVLESGCQNVKHFGRAGCVSNVSGSVQRRLADRPRCQSGARVSDRPGQRGHERPNDRSDCCIGLLDAGGAEFAERRYQRPECPAGPGLLQFRASIWRAIGGGTGQSTDCNRPFGNVSVSPRGERDSGRRDCRTVAGKRFREDRKRSGSVCSLNVASGVYVDGKVCNGSFWSASHRILSACSKRAGGSVAARVSVQCACSCLEWPGSDASPRFGVRWAGAIRDARRNRDVHSDRR